ncbi:hypothetical protein GCM10010503_24530 [Streptomyces lucensis JCM 4490]|uniref:DUF6777 domain-containing protein n=2 Tax=Streptomyces lucensis TaxID=67319 RepID=A0A918J4Q6_9ACTN|nr:hypothetical protein GCM10010503_24530 [Streptomyces lucensis JCM 4490]
MGEEVFLLPATAPGPDFFTASTAVGGTLPPASPPSPTAAAPRQPPPAGRAVPSPAGARALSGATPGLYQGTAHVADCDVGRQVAHLAADPVRAGAFAATAGVPRTRLPRHLRALTPVVLRTDTRVTSHAYHDRQVAAYQAVLQAGTAVLVDDRGVPRVRCACGNPLGPPSSDRGVGVRGTAWPGYRPDQVVVVTPAPRAVTGLTIVDVRTGAWIERRTGDDVRRDRVVPAPARTTARPRPPAVGPEQAGATPTGSPPTAPPFAADPPGTPRAEGGTTSPPGIPSGTPRAEGGTTSPPGDPSGTPGA